VNLLKKESSYGNTALHIAALKGDVVSVKLLFSECPDSAILINY